MIKIKWLPAVLISSLIFTSSAACISEAAVAKKVSIVKRITMESETIDYIPPLIHGSFKAVEETKYDNIDTIALVCMAEAEGESELGKRLVIDTILNRVDSPTFPNDVNSVIYQTGQFTSMWSGRAKRCRPTDYYRQLVFEEIANRLNYECVFFTAGNYSSYGKPMFKEGGHYFSKE